MYQKDFSKNEDFLHNLRMVTSYKQDFGTMSGFQDSYYDPGLLPLEPVEQLRHLHHSTQDVDKEINHQVTLVSKIKRRVEEKRHVSS